MRRRFLLAATAASLLVIVLISAVVKSVMSLASGSWWRERNLISPALQSRAARQIKNTGMVVTTDLVDNLDDIHPRDKQDVGRRLAWLALDKTYADVKSEM